MLWLKAFHLVFIVTWFAGLFYLPRLFVYHAMEETNAPTCARFEIMEFKLFWGIMTPSAILTVALGLAMLIPLWSAVYSGFLWMNIKLALVAVLFVYHVWCGVLIRQFKHHHNTHSHLWYRWFNEIPTVLLLAIVCLTVIKQPY